MIHETREFSCATWLWCWVSMLCLFRGNPCRNLPRTTSSFKKVLDMGVRGKKWRPSSQDVEDHKVISLSLYASMGCLNLFWKLSIPLKADWADRAMTLRRKYGEMLVIGFQTSVYSAAKNVLRPTNTSMQSATLYQSEWDWGSMLNSLPGISPRIFRLSPQCIELQENRVIWIFLKVDQIDVDAVMVLDIREQESQGVCVELRMIGSLHIAEICSLHQEMAKKEDKGSGMA